MSSNFLDLWFLQTESVTVPSRSRSPSQARRVKWRNYAKSIDFSQSNQAITRRFISFYEGDSGPNRHPQVYLVQEPA
jgi:hypothetical protein